MTPERRRSRTPLLGLIILIIALTLLACGQTETPTAEPPRSEPSAAELETLDTTADGPQEVAGAPAAAAEPADQPAQASQPETPVETSRKSIVEEDDWQEDTYQEHPGTHRALVSRKQFERLEERMASNA